MLTEADLPAYVFCAEFGTKEFLVTIHPPPFYVITGGPGSGKTTVVAELAHRGYQTMDKIAMAHSLKPPRDSR